MRTDGRTLNATAMCNYILQYCVRVRFQTFQIQNSNPLLHTAPRQSNRR